MAWKRTVVGSVLKDRNDPKKSYIKINTTVTLNKGDTLSLESPKEAIESAKEALASKKISEELFEQIKERNESILDFVRFNILKIEQR